MVKFRSLHKLESLSESYSNDLIRYSPKISKLFGHQVSLMEILAHECKKLNRLGYCDYELAYVSFVIVERLCLQYSKVASKEISVYANDIKQVIGRKKAEIDKIKETIKSNCTISNNGGNELSDPLIQRFNQLASVSNDDFPTLSDTSSTIKIEDFKYSELIGVESVDKLLSSGPIDKGKILFVDYRSRKEFEDSHISCNDIVNIPPDLIESIIQQDVNVLDTSLEEKLKILLPAEQYKRFINRQTYEMIILYDSNYGPSGRNPDRFQALRNSLINGTNNGITIRSPFSWLIDLLMYKNKYLSSKLSVYPCILAGGFSNWIKVLGSSRVSRSLQYNLQKPEKSLGKGTLMNNLPKQSNTNVIGFNNKTNSAYLKNFGEYLSTAKLSSPQQKKDYITNESLVSANRSSLRNHNQKEESNSHTPTQVSTNTVNQQQRDPRSRRPSLKWINSEGRNSHSYTPPKKVSSPITTKTEHSNPVRFLEQYTTGLTNLGNSCYMNCIIQSLGATPQLTNFFFPEIGNSDISSTSSFMSYRQHINVNNSLGSKGILTTNFVTLLMNMFSNEGGYFTPSEFKRIAGSLSPGRQFSTTDQQDCIEFLTFLLDTLHEDLNQMHIVDPNEKRAILELTPEQERIREILPVRLASTIEWERYLKLNFSIIVDYFQGQYLSQLKCLECGTTSTTYNAFSILSVPIPEKLGSFKNISLYDCIEEFVTLELLDDDNKWFCSKCKRSTKSTKKISITRLPQVLIIHFKRFKVSPNGQFKKLDTFIDYPVKKELDLTAYWPDVGTYISDTNSQRLSTEEELQVLTTLPTRNQVPPFRYKLFAVANHFGNLTSGHYTAYVYKDKSSSKTKNWCYFDDTKVTFDCKESQVLNKNAYCLFYQRS
ncbi:Piso0_005011 [Millerozyma farinosa CBS 7064]|uniref:Ubiquitin carboxyl-terminal hydrolase n=1 Tax=Pichia sorbitophila (strain ATCC MYA-4447 / BCRC 22081 / CBS 7064 / NBRC 10061 / NRRL Y-12695) TaxID=559304 RepID=G8Y3Z7_PICSO|nr:Piso0_005011 [Millerozyma farinosa CBS 7064]